MDNTQKTDIAQKLACLAVLFNEPFGEERLKLYLDCLDDLEPQEIITAAQKYTRIGKRFPFPADLRELINQEPA